MSQWGRWLVMVCMATMVAFSVTHGEIGCAETKGMDSVLQFLAVEKPGNDPIGLRAWYDKELGHASRTGDRLIVSFQTDRDGYVVLLNVIADRSIEVLFPNREQTNALVRKGIVCTLFGDDSRMRLALGKKVEKAQLVFCVSAKPFDLTSFPSNGAQPGLVLESVAETQLLRTKLHAMSQDRGFNRLILPFVETNEYGFQTELSLSALAGPAGSKGLPGGEDSERPGTVTGSQGAKSTFESK